MSISQIGLTGRLLTRYCQCPTKGDEAFRATHREGQGNTGHSTNLRPRPKVLAWRRNPARLAPPDGCQCITQPRHLVVPQALPELLIPVPNRVLQGLEELRARKDLASRVELKVDTAPVTYTTDDGLHQGPMATVGHFPPPSDISDQSLLTYGSNWFPTYHTNSALRMSSWPCARSRVMPVHRASKASDSWSAVPPPLSSSA